MLQQPPHRTVRFFAFWQGVFALLAFAILASGSAQAQKPPASSVLVRVQPGVNITRLAADYHVTLQSSLSSIKLYSVTVSGGGQARILAQLKKDARVVYAEANAPVSAVEVEGTQLHFAFDAGYQPDAYINQSAYAQIHLAAAQSITRGAGVTVAILDTGVMAQHPALVGHLLRGYNALNPSAPPDDLPDSTSNIAVGHGTMIAGIVARIAPDAAILPIRVLNSEGKGTLVSVIAGIHYAVAHGAKVINMSFGAAQRSNALDDVVDEANHAGVVMVASAGNNGAKAPRYPAALDKVLAVASVEASDIKSDYSNFGEYIGVDAPGTGIRSTYWTGGYATWTGTSFAAPFVTAAAALVFAAHPGCPAASVIAQIRRTANSVDRLNPNYQEMLGNGILNLEQAVSETLSSPPFGD